MTDHPSRRLGFRRRLHHELRHRPAMLAGVAAGILAGAAVKGGFAAMNSWLVGWTAGIAVKRACDDVKAYYYEAVAAQPGNLSATAIEQWFWTETAAAKVLLTIRDLCLKSEDESLKPLGKLSLIPRFVTDTEQKAREHAT